MPKVVTKRKRRAADNEAGLSVGNEEDDKEDDEVSPVRRKRGLTSPRGKRGLEKRVVRRRRKRPLGRGESMELHRQPGKPGSKT